MTHCQGSNISGEPCRSTLGLSDDGFCQAHREGGRERLAEIAAKGGAALAAKLAGEPIALADLQDIQTVDDAKRALLDVRNYVATRRLTHAEGNALTKTVEAWLKADAAGITKSLVNELRAELDAKHHEIESLKRQLGQHARNVRLAK